MNIELVILAIIIVVIILGITKIIKKGFSWKALFSLLLSVAVLGAGLKLQMDTDEFVKKFATEEKTVLLEENGQILAGMVGSLSGNETPKLVGIEGLAGYNELYKIKDFNGMKGESYKLIIVKSSAFDSIDSAEFSGEKYTKDFIFSLMRNNDAFQGYINEIMRRGIEKGTIKSEYEENAKKQYEQQITEQLGKSGEIKGAFFGVLISEATKKQGTIFLLEEYNQDKVMIYQENLMFRIIKIMPIKILRMFA